jgi:hypothetical protein
MMLWQSRASLSARSWADRKQPTQTHLRPGALGSERPNVHGVFYRNSTALGQAISTWTRHRIPGAWSSVRISRFRDGFARHSLLLASSALLRANPSDNSPIVRRSERRLWSRLANSLSPLSRSSPLRYRS